MERFPEKLSGDFLGDDCWILTSPFIRQDGETVIIVPIGFVTDGSSIPKFAQSILGGHWSGKHGKAAIPHDYGYSTRSDRFKRKEVDLMFYKDMRYLGVPFWKRWAMFNAVKFCAWTRWKKRK